MEVGWTSATLPSMGGAIAKPNNSSIHCRDSDLRNLHF
ncbi:hypothetical protein CKA32_005910 [Geitlerinema sp. FC II]|nr:hypothetical protein CKA32_005910 [Geitlerinema sp. FC II]